MATKPTARLRGITAPASTQTLTVRPSAAMWSERDPAHYGASLTSRELATWNPVAGSPDADILPDLGILRPRVRDLDRNNGIATGIHQTLADNIVGRGLRLASTPDYKALGRDKAWAEEWSTITESKFRAWAETTDCDAAGLANFAQLTTQVFRGGLLNGEGLALPLWLPGTSRYSPYSTKLQVIEADRLATPWGQIDGPHMRGGIEIDDYGRPTAYNIRKVHPGDLYLNWIGNVWQFEKIPAETSWGRKRIVHVHDQERSGMHRGKPFLTPVLQQFRMLDHYQRTEMQAAVVNAMIAAFIETPLDGQSLVELFGGDVTSTGFQQYLTQKNEARVPLKGGAVMPLYPGEKLSAFTPNRPNSIYQSFTEAITRNIGLSVGLPYELAFKDFSKTNYSSARAALIEAWRFFLGRREWLAQLWCRPVFELWLEEAVNLGEIEAPGFYENRYAYSRCRWIGPGRGWVDPVKEAQAGQIRMDAGFSTLEAECAEQGNDWEEVIEQRASELARIKEIETEYGVSLAPTLTPNAPKGEKSDPAGDQQQSGDQAA